MAPGLADKGEDRTGLHSTASGIPEPGYVEYRLPVGIASRGRVGIQRGFSCLSCRRDTGSG